MSPLRKQLEDDLAIRGMSERTRETYVGAVAALAKHYSRSPDRISQEEIQRYLLHLLTERKLAPSSCNVAASAFQFFYRVTLKRTAAQFVLPRPKQPQKLPQILAREEIARAIELDRGHSHMHHAMHNIGAAYSVLGEADEALEWLQHSAAEGFPCYPVFASDPDLAPLANDPRFQDFLARLKARWERYRRPL